ncbi:Response regulator receiver domain-containing protein [Dehalogenimonas formicexedens]|uniref:Response regulator receiver domain-containing protein n=1 Tax=Dehalogenimonas formicexedens TaxID=1839801 RepID=A0A1P8F654_9CHLR|nr:Response regulator receiver domain-containing protein [Dehalogenimonas formicexedens]
MKVWAATCDSAVLDLLNTAVRMRWPSSGRLIVPSSFTRESWTGARDCDLAVVDTSIASIDPCCLIQSVKNDTNIPILVLSDPKSDQTLTARALASGAEDYLFKPVEIIDMIFHMEAAAQIRLAK